MTFKTMTAVSVLALMISNNAFAQDVSAVPPTPDNSVLGNVKSGLRKADAGIRNTATDIKVFFVGKDSSSTLEPTLIQRGQTAHGLIGESVIDMQGKKIATLKDVIIDKDGKAVLIVVSDGGVLGIGDKVAAFDYSKAVAQETNGKVVMTLSHDMVTHAADFSYDRKDWAKAKVIPDGSISVEQLLKGRVLDYKGDKVASVENIYLHNAKASQIIVGFDTTFGMGGQLAAIDYNELEMVKGNDSLDFKLTEKQTMQFKNFKASVAN